MKLTPLCEMDVRYTWVEFVDFGVGGQYVGTMEGQVRGDRLHGEVKFINVPPRRPDNVNCPAFRGILTTTERGQGVSGAQRYCPPAERRQRPSLHHIADHAHRRQPVRLDEHHFRHAGGHSQQHDRSRPGAGVYL